MSLWTLPLHRCFKIFIFFIQNNPTISHSIALDGVNVNCH
nr:MAG TPA: hypothetical protein [Caudoviricetes sp.]